MPAERTKTPAWQVAEGVLDGLAADQEDIFPDANHGKLGPGANPDELATATLAAIQGGLLLTQAKRDAAPLATALDAAYANLRAHASSRTSVSCLRIGAAHVTARVC